MPTKIVTTGCCIAGAGPAGMMLGYLLARVGVEVIVLEKHADFLRDFRGDTIHPSTHEIMAELGLLGPGHVRNPELKRGWPFVSPLPGRERIRRTAWGGQ